jgi:phosphoribosyl 1,2-cyclic phosphodiesterase
MEQMSEYDIAAMTIRFRGVRGSTPSPGVMTTRYGGNTSCIEVRADREILVLDAGTGIRNLGTDLDREFGSSPIEAAVLISHTHWDHIQGLPFFAPAFDAKNRIRVIAVKNQGRTVKRALKNQMAPIHFPVGIEQMRGLCDVEELHSDKVVFGPFRIGVIGLNHPGGCAGFRLEANGASIAYLPDHEPFGAFGLLGKNQAAQSSGEALIEFVRNVDLLILDAQYTATEYPQRIGWGHGCVPNTVELAIKARVKELALFHHDPLHDDEQIDGIVKHAQQIARGASLNIHAATENRLIVLPHSRLPGRTAIAATTDAAAECIA